MVNRLKPIIARLISPFQIGFVLRRNISENIVVNTLNNAMSCLKLNHDKTSIYFFLNVDLDIKWLW